MFDFLNEKILVEVNGDKVFFSHQEFGNIKTEIDNLKLDKNGVIKEFPDLKDNINWKNIAIQRFKDKIKSLKNESERVNYIINDLKKFGYIPLYKQQKGFRIIKL
jgi:hypothetical protein